MPTKNAISFNDNELTIKKNCCGRKVYEEAKWKVKPVRPTQPVPRGRVSQRTPQPCDCAWPGDLVFVIGKMCYNK